MHKTEQVYDAEMAPLISQLIEIAKREHLPLLINVGMVLTTDDGEPNPGGCFTLIEGSDYPELAGMRNRHGLCRGIIHGHDGFDTASAMRITRHHDDAEHTPSVMAVLMVTPE